MRSRGRATRGSSWCASSSSWCSRLSSSGPRKFLHRRRHDEDATMKVLVAVKQVAALDEDFEIRADGRDVEQEFLVRDLNEWDDFSLEEAVKMKEAAGTPVEVVAVCVGPEEADEALRKCLAKGADRAIRVWDESAAGSDAIAIARLVAAVARREQPQLLFAGTQSADHAFAATGMAGGTVLHPPPPAGRPPPPLSPRR